MLKKRVAALDVEVKSDYITAAKKSVLDYILLDEDERLRLNISVRPSPWEPRVVRAPVPWHQNFLQAKQFCRHNLFSLNTVMVKLNDLWWRRYNNLRFVVPNRLRGVDGGPVSPQDLEDRVFTQCEEARTVLLKRWLPEVAMVFVKQRKAWASLVPRLELIWDLKKSRNLDTFRKKGESLRQVEKFFLCVRAMMSMHLRSMCIKTLEDFITYMRTYMVSFNFSFMDYNFISGCCAGFSWPLLFFCCCVYFIRISNFMFSSKYNYNLPLIKVKLQINGSTWKFKSINVFSGGSSLRQLTLPPISSPPKKPYVT